MFIRGAKHLQVAVWRAIKHDDLSIAKGAAYSAMTTLFPGLLALAGILARQKETADFLREFSIGLGIILPPSVADIARNYFDPKSHKPIHIIYSAGAISIFAATGVLMSWMQGFRCAFNIEKNPWGFVHERLVALALVPSALVPMFFATLLVAFGNQIETWISLRVTGELRPLLFIVWMVIRWVIALLTSTIVLSVIYHFAIPRTQPWRRVLPGATLATVLWFPTTLIFGWYVTHYANYTVIYGSLAAAIALLIWLYILSLLVLLGAEFNATIFPRIAAGPQAAP